MDESGERSHTFGFYDENGAPSKARPCAATLVGVEPCCLRVGCETQLQVCLHVEHSEADGLAVPLYVRVLVQDNVIAEQLCEVDSGQKLRIVRLSIPTLTQGQARLLVTKRNCTGRVHVSYPLLVLPPNASNELHRVQMTMLQRSKRPGMDAEWACGRVMEKHFVPFLEDFASVQLLCGPPSASSTVRLPPAKVLEMSCRVLTFLKGNAMWECLVSLLLLSDKHKDSQLHQRLQDVGMSFQQLLEKISDASFNHMFASSSSSSSDKSSPPGSPLASSPRSPRLLSRPPSPSPAPAQSQQDQDPVEHRDLPSWIVAYMAALKGQFPSQVQEQTYAQEYQRSWFARVDSAMVALYLVSGLLVLIAGRVSAASLVSASTQLVMCLLRILLYIGTKNHPIKVRHASLLIVMLLVVLLGRGSALWPSVLTASRALPCLLPPFQVPALHQLGLSVACGLLPGTTSTTTISTVATLTLSLGVTLLHDFLMRLHFLAAQHAKQS